jgi:hypothetical protein
MVEIYPVVKVSNLEQMGIVDFTFDPLHGYIIHGIPSLYSESYLVTYGYPDFSKSATITVYALPTDTITFNSPSMILLRFDNSFNYVSSGGAYRNAYIGTFKVPHSPVLPRGSGQLIMAWKTNKINWFLANNQELYRAYPVWDIQDTTTYSTNSTTPVEQKRWDFGSIKYRDILSYIATSLDSTYNSYVYFEVSNDGTTWTRIGSITIYGGADYRAGAFIASNVSFRYLRVLHASGTSSTTSYLRILKLFVFE